MKKRDVYLDTLRTIAIISIVMDHAVMMGYHILYASFAEEFQIYSWCGKIIRIATWEFSRWGVPIFLIISGALILNKNLEKIEDIKIFYKKNVIPLIVINEIWVVIDYLVAYFLNRFDVPCVYAENSSYNLSFKEFMYSILMIKRSCFPNMWYIPMIIGMYVFLPYVAEILKKYWSIIKYVLFIWLIMCFLPNDISYVLRIMGYDIQTNPIISVAFSGGVYGIYIIVGWYLAGNESFVRKISSPVLILILTVIICTDIALTMLYFNRGYINSMFAANNSFLQLSTVAIVFELCRRIKYLKSISIIVKYLACYSFPIYLMHYPIMLVVDNVISKTNLINESYSTIRVGLCFMITMGVCILISMLIPNCSFIRKYVFHMPMKQKIKSNEV